MDKVLHIQDCYFRLPENFNGTCGNALMLLALQCLEREKQQAIIYDDGQDENRLNDFLENNYKCVMTCCIDTEENIKIDGKE